MAFTTAQENPKVLLAADDSALPHGTGPYRALPCRTAPYPTKLYQAVPKMAFTTAQERPRRPWPLMTAPHRTLPYRGQPCPDAPRLATPRHTKPCHAEPRPRNSVSSSDGERLLVFQLDDLGHSEATERTLLRRAPIAEADLTTHLLEDRPEDAGVEDIRLVGNLDVG